MNNTINTNFKEEEFIQIPKSKLLELKKVVEEYKEEVKKLREKR